MPRKLRIVSASGTSLPGMLVNDGYVMAAWGKELGAFGKVRMLGDGSADFFIGTRAHRTRIGPQKPQLLTQPALELRQLPIVLCCCDGPQSGPIPVATECRASAGQYQRRPRTGWLRPQARLPPADQV